MSEGKATSEITKVILPIPFLLEQQDVHQDSFENLELDTNISSSATTDNHQPAIAQKQSLVQCHPPNLQHQKHVELAKQQPPLRVKRQTRTRNYKVYNGKSIFFCGGRFLTSRAFWAFSISIAFLLVPSILFLIFTCPWLWHHISPAVPLIFVYLFCLTLTSMLKTSWTDPGILPRNLDMDSLIHGNDAYNYRYSVDVDRFPLPKEVTIKGTSVRLKYCETCCIYRPPRASHCRQCDNCVGSFFIAIFCFLLLFPIGCLTGYHCFLVMRGVTTHEQLRANLASTPFEDHPFDFGNPFKNMLHVLCRPHNKSYIARRKFAEEIVDITVNSSNLSTATQGEINQVSTFDTMAGSNVPLHSKQA
ncbi:hypothetical protein BDF20DRAFT_827730 [Mycotypha africana]|uniref:uncharacterized protein n=1 Tax=Mycotypha africana TaxID=64632 RepID=UPI00230106D6|nr:uncharacterized protein BDF20DRAFT_827730 [Mycotypha africana]KAI8968224.1 hypothetical protein BDF20DRAFT_827730 [Mycotypha africana]